MQPEYDVFFSHKSTDKPQVKEIAIALQQSQISVWLDEWELQPGLSWQLAIEKAIENSRAVAVFIGPDGVGPWEQPEMRVALDEQVRRGCPVIPVLLPGVADSIKLPAFLRPNTWVDLRNGIDDRVGLNRLRWGITGKKPVEDTPTPQAAPRRIEEAPNLEPSEEAIANLSRLLKRLNITYFVGAGTCYESLASSGRTSDIARNLLSELNLISENYDQLLPTIDIAGLYYAIRSGDGNLENRIAELTALSHAVAPPTHRTLAELISTLKNRPVRRSLKRPPQLIVTTNFDLMMERALLRAGISFTRIVQHRSARRIDINEYRDVRLIDDVVEVRPDRGAPLQAGVDVAEELDEVISFCGSRTIKEESSDGGGENSSPLHELSLQDLTEPILYKFLGSQDLPNSCAISVEHYFEFARRTLRRNCIPAQISEIIASSPILFLGYGFLDPDFRLLYFTLLRKPLEVQTDFRYALQLPPERYEGNAYRQMEFKTKIWERIKEGALRKLGITTLEEQDDVFLGKLHRAVQQNQ